ncbi:uncharacterized protein [Elaeis guineensis]|uniref:uncharacterized protein n=1 Tax=Elaeis guineensis var. tenera TaxID=51953 RepID=UPI003C6D9E67
MADCVDRIGVFHAFLVVHVFLLLHFFFLPFFPFRNFLPSPLSLSPLRPDPHRPPPPRPLHRANARIEDEDLGLLLIRVDQAVGVVVAGESKVRMAGDVEGVVAALMGKLVERPSGEAEEQQREGRDNDEGHIEEGVEDDKVMDNVGEGAEDRPLEAVRGDGLLDLAQCEWGFLRQRPSE